MNGYLAQLSHMELGAEKNDIISCISHIAKYELCNELKKVKCCKREKLR